MDQLCTVAQVSKRTLYQHFTGKRMIAKHLRRFDPDILPEVFDRTDLTPRERLLAAFEVHAPLYPFIAAAVEIPDPGHPAHVHARDYKNAFAARLTDAAREAGATNPEQLGEQLALLLDGASARSRVLNTETLATPAASQSPRLWPSWRTPKTDSDTAMTRVDAPGGAGRTAHPPRRRRSPG